jgi:crotonobetaine/carnitine-CoA ligase
MTLMDEVDEVEGVVAGTSIEEIAAQRWTFSAVLDQRCAETPDKVFLQFDAVALTFADCRTRVRSVANQLLALGVEPGDTVALLTANCAEWVCTWLACAEIGATSMPINTMFRGEFLRHQLADAHASIMLLDAQFARQVSEVIADLPSLTTLLVRNISTLDVTFDAAAVAVMDAAVLAEGATEAIVGGRHFGWNEVACLFYTSGTTGPSKGAMLTQQYLCVAAHALAQSYAMTSDDVMYAAVPLFHLGGAYGVVVGSLMSGRTAVLDSAFSVSNWAPRVRQVGATIFLGVGPMIAMLMSVPTDPGDGDLPLRLIVASPVPPALQPKVEERFNCTVVQCFGQTEAIPVALSAIERPSAPGAAGRVGPLHDVRILSEDDLEVPSGAVGEIAIRPRFAHVMFEGYLNRPETTVGQPRNLWFHTGDLGRIDEQGDLWWVDRKKDAIRRRGENVSSFEVEQVVLAHPSVLECAVIGVPSDVGEEDIKLCVIARPGEPLPPSDLVAFCADRLPAFAVPRYVEFLDALPKNVLGRVQKHILRSSASTAGSWDRLAPTSAAAS